MTESHLHPLTVESIQQREDKESPLLQLQDDLGRLLEIPIGLCEALAIQRAIEGQQTARPLTHDLILALADRLEAPVARLVIDDYSNGTYYARLILTSSDGPVSLDCRPSDGVALALRAKAPILASDAVMEEGAGKG